MQHRKPMVIRLIYKLIIVLAVAYLAVALLMFVFQRSLLYIPSKNVPGPGQLTSSGLAYWPDQNAYRGFLTQPSRATATVVVFHGNAGTASDRAYYVDALEFASARILLAEYPGYGARSGSPSETLLANDALDTLRMLKNTFPDEPLYVLGESLGAGVAAAAALLEGETEASLIDGILLITPWDSLVKLAQRHYRYLPVRLLLRDRYPSVENLSQFQGPTLVVLAERDQIIPISHGHTLFESLPAPKKLMTVNDAGHNDWPNHVDEQWWRAAWHWLHLAPAGHADD